jgi:iron complex transport system substrate-binding protein
MTFNTKKMNFIFFVCSIVLISILFLSLSPDKKRTEIRDDAGRTVVFPNTPVTIVSLSPSNTEILFAIGCGKNIIGVTEFCNYPPEAKKIARIGGFSQANIERIMALSPDIIFASQLHVSEVLPRLEKLGLRVVVLNPVKIASVFDSISLAGRILDKEAESGKVVAKLRKEYESISAKLKKSEKISVYWELSEDRWTVGQGSFINEIITEAGGANIASGWSRPWLQLNSEYILKANPSVIFLADHPFETKSDTLLKRPGWSSIAAMKTGRIIGLSADEDDLVSRPGPRIVEALEFVARRLHPELF